MNAHWSCTTTVCLRPIFRIPRFWTRMLPWPAGTGRITGTVTMCTAETWSASKWRGTWRHWYSQASTACPHLQNSCSYIRLSHLHCSTCICKGCRLAYSRWACRTFPPDTPRASKSVECLVDWLGSSPPDRRLLLLLRSQSRAPDKDDLCDT